MHIRTGVETKILWQMAST